MNGTGSFSQGVVVPVFCQEPPDVHDLNNVESTATFLKDADSPN